MPQACAVEIHTDILQEPFFARIWQEKLHSKNGTPVLCLHNWKCAWTSHETVWIRTNAGEQKACKWVERAWFPFSFLHTCSCWFRVVRRVTAKLYVLQPLFWNLMFPEKKIMALVAQLGVPDCLSDDGHRWWVRNMDDECTHGCATPSGTDKSFIGWPTVFPSADTILTAWPGRFSPDLGEIFEGSKGMVYKGGPQLRLEKSYQFRCEERTQNNPLLPACLAHDNFSLSIAICW